MIGKPKMFRDLTPTKEVLEELQNKNLKLLAEIEEKDKTIKELEESDSFFGSGKKLRELKAQNELLSQKLKEDWDSFQEQKETLRRQSELKINSLTSQLTAVEEKHREHVSNCNGKVNKLELELSTLKQKVKESKDQSAENKCLIFGNLNMLEIQNAISQAIVNGYKLQHFVVYRDSTDAIRHEAVMIKE